MGGPAPRLTVIIVNYESWSETSRLTDSLSTETEFTSGLCQIVVVDNASLGPVPDSMATLRAGLHVLARPDNGGFAVGVNAGWRASRSSWLLVLNPDVEIHPGFLGQVLAKIAEFDQAPGKPPGLVGFGLRNPDGSPQGSVGVFPSLGRTLLEQFIPRSRRKYQSGSRIRSTPVDWVTGACMLVNSAVFEELGGMDEDFFLYHEEVAFCRRAIEHGWRVEHDPTLSVVHTHPLQNRPISPKMRVILRHSKLLYFRKHLQRWQFLGLSTIVELESVIRGPWCRFRGNREEARAWRMVRRISRDLRRGKTVRGREVLALASSVLEPAAGPLAIAGGSESEYPEGGPASTRGRGRSHSRVRPTHVR
jgi:GT2 family glycosyltransferase